MLRNSFLLIFLFLFLSHRTYSELLPLYGLFLLRHCILKYVTVQSQPPKCYAFRRCGVSVNGFSHKSVRSCKHHSHFCMKIRLALNGY